MKRPPLFAQAPLAALLACTLAACSAPPSAENAGPVATYESAAHNAFIASSHQAIDDMVQGLSMAYLDQAPVLVATVVNVNDLTRTAPLGRTLSEIYASRLANKGFHVRELKLRGEVYVKEGTGELLLSREIRDIAKHHSASLVLVGTYSQAQNYTYVSLKLVRTADNRIIRSHDYALPNDRDIQRLLGGGTGLR